MPLRKRILIVLGIAIVFTAGAFLARGLQSPPIFSLAVQPQATTPEVISGADLGFRLERTKGDTAIGTLVVRVNGQWLEVVAKGRLVPVGGR